tara:strand:- start:2376 stop:2570 length:195 start_codon:yes stop_codon:yes gene_type:complete
MGCLFSFFQPPVEEITPEKEKYLYYNEPFIKKQMSEDNYSIKSSDSPQSYYDEIVNRFNRITYD